MMSFRVLVLGASGQLGRELLRLIRHFEFIVTGLDLDRLDITDAGAVDQTIHEISPQFVINAAAYTAVDNAEEDTCAAFTVNCTGAANVARACGKIGAPLIHISTDYVFDGLKRTPYREDDDPHPINIYGKSKLAGEAEIKRLCEKHLVIRTSWLFGSHGRNFVKTMMRLGRERETVNVVNDQFGCPTPASDLAEVILRVVSLICRDKVSAPWGIYHYCGNGPVSWYTFAQSIFSVVRDKEAIALKHLLPVDTAAFPTAAARPRYSVLSCERIKQVFGIVQRPWTEGLRRVIDEVHAKKP